MGFGWSAEGEALPATTASAGLPGEEAVVRVQSVGTGPVGGETGSGACCVLLRSLGFVLWLVRRTEGCKQRLESVPTEEPRSRAATPTAHAQPRPAPEMGTWSRFENCVGSQGQAGPAHLGCSSQGSLDPR